MKQFIVNKLEGGFIVQTVVDGQQTSQKIVHSLGQVSNAFWDFFNAEAANVKEDFAPWGDKAIKAAGPAEGKEIPF